MQIRMRLDRIPWAMAAGRAALGPVLIAGERCGWDGTRMAWIVVAALVSDVFDGVLARWMRSDTAGLRLFDSMSDTVFYLCVAIAIAIGQPQVWRENAWLLAGLMGLEAARMGAEFWKFGRPASYHSYLAKTWGLVLAIAVVGVFAWPKAHGLMPAALALGIVCDLEGLAMTLMLPEWRRDVKTLAAAWRLRTKRMESEPEGGAGLARHPAVTAVVVMVAMALACTLPAQALDRGKAVYEGGTIKVAPGTVGSLDVTSRDALMFQYRRPDGTADEIAMAYASIGSIEPTSEPTAPLGLIPQIAVSLVSKLPRRYLVTVRYEDASGTEQVVVLDVPRRDQAVVVAVVNARSHRSCAPRGYPCSASMERR